MRTDSLGFIIILGALAALPPLSIDMGLPAFGSLQQSLGASAGQAALTLSVFMAGFGAAQIVVGPLSDRYGRRPVILSGLALYAFSGLGCALAPSIQILLSFRLIAGLAAAASSTLALAVARDLFEGDNARVKLSAIATVSTIAPMIAPTLGGIVLAVGDWRFIYALLGTAGVIQFCLVWRLLSETRPPQPGSRINIIGRYGAVLRVRRTVGYALVNACGSAGMFSYISASSAILMGRMGASTFLFGLLFAATSGGIMLGARINAALAHRRVRPAIPLAIALTAAPLAALAGLLLLLAGYVQIETFVPPVILFCVCRGLTNPNATHAALEQVASHAGTAASLLGCAQMLGGALAGAAVAASAPMLGIYSTSIGMLVCSSAAFLTWRWVETPAPQT